MVWKRRTIFGPALNDSWLNEGAKLHNYEDTESIDVGYKLGTKSSAAGLLHGWWFVDDINGSGEGFSGPSLPLGGTSTNISSAYLFISPKHYNGGATSFGGLTQGPGDPTELYVHLQRLNWKCSDVGKIDPLQVSWCGAGGSPNCTLNALGYCVPGVTSDGTCQDCLLWNGGFDATRGATYTASFTTVDSYVPVDITSLIQEIIDGTGPENSGVFHAIQYVYGAGASAPSSDNNVSFYSTNNYSFKPYIQIDWNDATA